MAKSGTITKSFSSGYSLIIEWSESNVNTSNNTSDITCTVKLSATGSYYISSTASKSIKLSINGTTYSSTCTVKLSAGATKTLMTKTVTGIKHSSDGTKTVSLSCTLGIEVTLGGSFVSSVTASGSATLTKIGRASSMSVPDGTLGTAISISVTKAVSSYTHTIVYTIPSTGSSQEFSVCSKSSATSISYTPPLSLAQYNADGTSIVLQFKITTYNGSTVVSTAKDSATFKFPASIKPSVSLSYEDASGMASKCGGKYLQGVSKAKVTITTTESYESAIKSVKTVIDGTTYTKKSFTANPFATSGSKTITVTVVDGRGRSATASATISVVPYKKPSLKFSTSRCNSDGKDNPNGGYIKVKFDYSTTLVESANQNVTAKIKYKKKSATSYSSITLTKYQGTYNVVGGTHVFAADANTTYDVNMELSDGLSPTITVNGSGTAAEHFMSWFPKGMGIAFGKMAELKGYFDVAWTVMLRKNLHFDNTTNTERNIYMKNDACRQGHTYSKNGVYPHNSKMYGGSGTSKFAIGWYDSMNSKRILAWNDVDQVLSSEVLLERVSVPITVNTSGATSVSVSYCYAIPLLGIVVFAATFAAKDLAAGSNKTVASISTNYTPIVDYVGIAAHYAGTAKMAGYVGKNGNIAINSNTALSTANVRMSGVWVYR